MHRATTIRLLPLAAAIGLLSSAPAGASTFQYDGRLDDGGRPADGRYDLSLTAYPAEKLGSTLAAPMVFEDVLVRDGRFRLEFDLQSTEASQAWLELGVRDGASAGAFSAIPGRAKAVAAPLVGACWSTTGDTGVNPTSNFLGTIDNQPLVLRSNNAETGRFTPDGLRINGDAWDGLFELAIRGTAGFGGDVVNIVMEPRVTPAPAFREGVIISAGGGTPGQNNVGFLVQQSDIAAGKNLISVQGTGRGTFAGTGASANGDNAVALGGTNARAAGARAVVLGGASTEALGSNAVANGEQSCAGGDNSFAGGRFAQVRRPTGSTASAGCQSVSVSGDANGDEGSFVWNGSVNTALQTTGPRQFLVGAPGGVALNGPPVQDIELTVNGNDSFGNLFLRQLSTNPDTGGFLFSVGESAVGSNSAQFYLDQYTPNLALNRRFVIDNNGGIAFNRGDATINAFNDPGALVVGSNATNGNRAYLSTGGTWVNASSRTLKEAFEAVDVGAVLSKVLDLSITTWRYTGSNEGRHLGPVAEDFHAAFGLGAGERTIATVDSAGVALAAIQGLNQKLEAENAALRARLAAIEARLGLE
jgi:hypothetical protein